MSLYWPDNNRVGTMDLRSPLDVLDEAGDDWWTASDHHIRLIGWTEVDCSTTVYMQASDPDIKAQSLFCLKWPYDSCVWPVQILVAPGSPVGVDQLELIGIKCYSPTTLSASLSKLLRTPPIEACARNMLIKMNDGTRCNHTKAKHE